jgi:MFS family permease
MSTEKLTFTDMRTLALAALGGALEFYDFVIFVFFTKTLSAVFFPQDMPYWLAQFQVYGIFAAGYIARPIGGIIMAHFGDLLGRKKMFALSVLLMSLPTLLIGLLPTYHQLGLAAPLLLLILRIIQGIAIGGEVPAAWVFVAEHVPPSRIGFACASLTSGLTLGILLGSLMGSAIYTQLTPAAVISYGWRIAFIVGGIFGILAVWLRRWLKETPVFEAMKERKEISQDIPLKNVLKHYKKQVLTSMLITWMLTAAIMVLILMTPTLIQSQFGISPALALRGNNWASLALVFGCLGGGLIADKLGHAKALFVGSAILLVTNYLLYLDLQNGAAHFLLFYPLTGLSVGVVGVVPAVLVGSFPPEIRFSGVSFSYNMSYAVFGGLTPPLISYLSSHFGGLAPAHYVALTIIICLLVATKLHFDLLKNKG